MSGIGDNCLIWPGGCTSDGYGETFVNGRVVYVHRIAYEGAFGPIPDGFEIDHLCRNRACCNPAHLEAVTRAVNTRRGKNTKLTLEKAREIRALRAEGATYPELVERFAVSDSAIWSVLSGRSWREGVAIVAPRINLSSA
jgi:hypothetical protein